MIQNPMREGVAMRYELFEDRAYSGDWRVERLDPSGDGTMDVAIFSGPRAETLAREYFVWRTQRERPKKSTAPLRLVR